MMTKQWNRTLTGIVYLIILFIVFSIMCNTETAIQIISLSNLFTFVIAGVIMHLLGISSKKYGLFVYGIVGLITLFM